MHFSVSNIVIVLFVFTASASATEGTTSTLPPISASTLALTKTTSIAATTTGPETTTEAPTTTTTFSSTTTAAVTGSDDASDEVVGNASHAKSGQVAIIVIISGVCLFAIIYLCYYKVSQENGRWSDSNRATFIRLEEDDDNILSLNDMKREDVEMALSKHTQQGIFDINDDDNQDDGLAPAVDLGIGSMTSSTSRNNSLRLQGGSNKDMIVFEI